MSFSAAVGDPEVDGVLSSVMDVAMASSRCLKSYCSSSDYMWQVQFVIKNSFLCKSNPHYNADESTAKLLTIPLGLATPMTLVRKSWNPTIFGPLTSMTSLTPLYPCSLHISLREGRSMFSQIITCNIVFFLNQNMLYLLLESKEPRVSSWDGLWSLKLGLASCHRGLERTWKSQATLMLVEKKKSWFKKYMVDQCQVLPAESVVKVQQFYLVSWGASFCQMGKTKMVQC